MPYSSPTIHDGDGACDGGHTPQPDGCATNTYATCVSLFTVRSQHARNVSCMIEITHLYPPPTHSGVVDSTVLEAHMTCTTLILAPRGKPRVFLCGAVVTTTMTHNSFK